VPNKVLQIFDKRWDANQNALERSVIINLKSSTKSFVVDLLRHNVQHLGALYAFNGGGDECSGTHATLSNSLGERRYCSWANAHVRANNVART